MYKQIIRVAAISCFLFIGQPAMVHAHGSYGMTNVLESLQLTEEQKTKAKSILMDMRNQMKEQVSKMQPLREEIRNQIESDKMDANKLNQAIDEKSKIIGEMMKIKANKRHEIYMLLDEKQKSEFKTGMAKYKEMIQQKMKETFKGE